MNYQSLLELLATEETLCRKLQTKTNIMYAIRQVDEEGTQDTEEQRQRRADLQRRLAMDVMELNRALEPLRAAIGARIMELQAKAEGLIRAEMERSERNGE